VLINVSLSFVRLTIVVVVVVVIAPVFFVVAFEKQFVLNILSVRL